MVFLFLDNARPSIEHYNRLLSLAFDPRTLRGSTALQEIFATVWKDIDEVGLHRESFHGVDAKRRRCKALEKIKSWPDYLRVTTHDGRDLNISVADIMQGLL